MAEDDQKKHRGDLHMKRQRDFIETLRGVKMIYIEEWRRPTGKWRRPIGEWRRPIGEWRKLAGEWRRPLGE